MFPLEILCSLNQPLFTSKAKAALFLEHMLASDMGTRSSISKISYSLDINAMLMGILVFFIHIHLVV